MSPIYAPNLDDLLIWHMLRGAARVGYTCQDCGSRGEIDPELWHMLAKVNGRRFPVKDLGQSLGCTVCTSTKRIQGRVTLYLIDGERLPF